MQCDYNYVQGFKKSKGKSRWIARINTAYRKLSRDKSSISKQSHSSHQILSFEQSTTPISPHRPTFSSMQPLFHLYQQPHTNHPAALQVLNAKIHITSSVVGRAVQKLAPNPSPYWQILRFLSQRLVFGSTIKCMRTRRDGNIQECNRKERCSVMQKEMNLLRGY